MHAADDNRDSARAGSRAGDPVQDPTGYPVPDPAADGNTLRRRMFTTRSHAWREVGLARELSRKAARRARIQAAVLLPILAGVYVIFLYRDALFGKPYDVPVRVGAALALIMVGWQFARDIGRSIGPDVFRRLQPGTAGTAGFVIRLLAMLITTVVALRVAGLGPRSLALGGAFTAVIVGLAAQQTLGNLIAGMVLLSARPFRVGDRVRFQAGGLAGSAEGIVSSLGLLYTTLAHGDDAIMVPNSLVLSAAVVPLREPSGVDLRARLRPGVTPSDVQNVLDETLTTPVRDIPRIILEEIDGDEVVVRIQATPERAADGPRLASEVLGAIGRETARAA